MILVKSVSRLARNTIDVLEAVQNLRRKDVYFYFKNEMIYTKDNSKDFLLTIYALYAQEESIAKSKNISWGIKATMKNGEFKMKKVYGYDVIDHELYINESEAEVIKMIFNMYVNFGLGAQKIKEALETMEILSPGGCKKWNCKTIMEILKSETYIGDIILQKTFTKDVFEATREKNVGQLDKIIYKDDHDMIINEETFLKADELRMTKEFGGYQKNQFKPQFALSRLIKCGECGSNYFRRTERGKAVYCCSKRMRHGRSSCPCSITIDEDELLNKLKELYNVREISDKFLEERIENIMVRDEIINIMKFEESSQTQQLTNFELK